MAVSLTGAGAGAADVVAIDPTTVANVLDYWDADDLGAGGSSVASWTGRKSARVMSQATGANQPTVAAAAINGHKAVTFDGVNDSLAYSPGSAFVTSANVECFVVLSHTGGTGDIVAVSIDDGTAGDWNNQASAEVVLRLSAAQQIAAFRNSLAGGVLSWPDARSSFGLVQSYWTGTTHTLIEGGASNSVTAAWTTFNANRLTLGAGISALATIGAWWGGQVAALVLANGLTASERAGIRSFLGNRFAL